MPELPAAGSTGSATTGALCASGAVAAYVAGLHCTDCCLPNKAGGTAWTDHAESAMDLLLGDLPPLPAAPAAPAAFAIAPVALLLLLLLMGCDEGGTCGAQQTAIQTEQQNLRLQTAAYTDCYIALHRLHYNRTLCFTLGNRRLHSPLYWALKNPTHHPTPSCKDAKPYKLCPCQQHLLVCYKTTVMLNIPLSPTSLVCTVSTCTSCTTCLLAFAPAESM